MPRCHAGAYYDHDLDHGRIPNVRPGIFRRWLHDFFGWHVWHYAKGDYNRYYVCSECGARKVNVGYPGYQPIDNWWLNASPDDRRPPLVLPQYRPSSGNE